VLAIIVLASSVTIMFGIAFYLQVGPIRSVAFFATIILLLMTVYFNPSRLLVAFGVFLMFVAASLSFEVAPVVRTVFPLR